VIKKSEEGKTTLKLKTLSEAVDSVKAGALHPGENERNLQETV
jgi:hypothetical protein